MPAIAPKHRPESRTELEAVELMRWAKLWLGLLRRPIWLGADGAYAKKNVLKTAKALGRGSAPTYGFKAIDLAKRAGQKRGWS